MTSRSAKISAERPFYELPADAYDALITDPVEPWVDAIDRCLDDGGFPSASILDGGCGTGRHAAALIRRGHRPTLVDASPGLLAIAARRCPGAPAVLADICAPGLDETFDAVTCPAYSTTWWRTASGIRHSTPSRRSSGLGERWSWTSVRARHPESAPTASGGQPRQRSRRGPGPVGLALGPLTAAIPDGEQTRRPEH